MVQITRNVASTRARGFARGFIFAEGGGVAPVLLVSVHPWVCFMISMSKQLPCPFLGDYYAASKSKSVGRCEIARYLYRSKQRTVMDTSLSDLIEVRTTITYLTMRNAWVHQSVNITICKNS